MSKPDTKIKSFQLSEGKTSVFQIGLILLVALFFIGLVWLGGWGVEREIDNTGSGNMAQKELSATEKELKFQEQAAGIVKTKDFSGCEKISDATYKSVCINNIALNLAKETQDISYCQKIDDKLIPRSDCERQVLFTKSLEKENIEVCREASGAEIQKQCEDSFYSQLALKKDDIKICDQSLEKDKADFCYDTFLFEKNFALQNNKDFNCSLFRGQDNQNDCLAFKKVAGNNDFSACLNLKTDLFSRYCSSVILR